MAISCPLSPTPHLYHTATLSLSVSFKHTLSFISHTHTLTRTHWLTKGMINIPKLIKGNNLLMFLYLTRCRFNLFLTMVIQEDSFFFFKLVTSNYNAFLYLSSIKNIVLCYKVLYTFNFQTIFTTTCLNLNSYSIIL